MAGWIHAAAASRVGIALVLPLLASDGHASRGLSSAAPAASTPLAQAGAQPRVIPIDGPDWRPTLEAGIAAGEPIYVQIANALKGGAVPTEREASTRALAAYSKTRPGIDMRESWRVTALLRLGGASPLGPEGTFVWEVRVVQPAPGGMTLNGLIWVDAQTGATDVLFSRQ